jgi:amino acid permease
MAETSVGAGERTPLLLSSEEKTSNEDAASNTATALNLMKTCMGTGCLALPFACQQGGIVLFTAGLVAVSSWNVYSVQRLVACLQYLPDDNNSPLGSTDDEEENGDDVTGDEARSLQVKPPPEEISLLGKVAWHAYGPMGLEVLDIMMMILLLGVIVAYFCAILTFLSDTPLSLGGIWDGLVTALILTCISLVPHVGVLSQASALGLTVLFLTFVVIFSYGILGDDSSHAATPIAMWPHSMQGLSQLFGVVVFGFGVVPMTYNFRSSMQQPGCMIEVTACAMGATAASYFVAGVGLYVLFPALQGDVLSELPTTGFLPVVSRLAMVFVVLMTAPLIIVPCSELLEGKWQREEIWMIRLGICTASCLVAVAFPNFVQALSLVGSTCVATVSFCIPPLLHLRLHSMRHGNLTAATALDLVMLVLGIATTTIATIYNLRAIYNGPVGK